MHENTSSEHEHLAHPGTPIARESRELDEGDVEGGRDVAPSSQGLGAVFGDAERSPRPGPVRPPSPADQAAMDAVEERYEVGATEEGERYLTPRDGDTESSPTTVGFPESSPT